MTLKTEILGFALQGKAVVALVRIMTTDAVTIGHRTVAVLHKHHIAIIFMARKTQLGFIAKELEAVILTLNRNVTNSADAGPDRAMDELLGTHVLVAATLDTAGVSLRHRQRTNADNQ